MGVMIQIRNVPEQLHRTLKAKAARLGLSLSDFALSELARAANRPTAAEIFADIRADPPVKTRLSSADLIRAERDTL